MKKRQLMGIMTSAMLAAGTVGSAASVLAGEEDNTLTAALIQGVTGDFGGDYWSAGVDDLTIWRMTVKGYPVAQTDLYGMYVLNETAVASCESEENEDGSKTFTIQINEGLVYNNGDPITAADYVARLLYTNMPAFGEAGAYTTNGMYFVGHTAYSKGETEIFEGVHLIDEYTFSVTVSSDYVPDYSELRFLTGLFPLPLQAWTDGSVTVEETEEGAKFSKVLTIDDIQDYVKTERYTPTVTCGAYNLDSFDTNSLTATLSINENFAGNFEGQVPSIEKLILKDIYSSSSYTDELKTGSVELVSGQGKGTNINAFMDMYDEGLVEYTCYDGNQVQGLQLRCDFGATQFTEVRQALVYAMNREEIVSQLTGGYGIVANSYYSGGMWMYQETADTLDEQLNQYSYNLDAAEQVLIEGGWTLNEKGEEFVKGTDTVRYKDVDGELMKCEVRFLGTPTSTACDLYIAMLSENLPKIGMEFSYDQLEWAVCLDYLYRNEPATYNMIACGADLSDPAFDVTYDYTTDETLISQGYNLNMLLDEELESCAKALIATDPEDEEGYLDNFVKFQLRWNEILPMVPIYTSSTYDFYIPELKGYEASCYTDYSYSLLYAYFE